MFEEFRCEVSKALGLTPVGYRVFPTGGFLEPLSAEQGGRGEPTIETPWFVTPAAIWSFFSFVFSI